MLHPTNPFKTALKSDRPLIGLWQGLASSYTVELCAGVGYDWLLIDGEHVPNTLQTILAQMQAVAAYNVAPVVRPASNDAVQLKLLLDIGVQNFFIPMVQNAADAQAAVAAVRYPPLGIRGVGTALARAAKWGGVSDYVTRADEEICLICQVESAQGVQHLDDILQVDGVDGVFIGPADLAASMGHISNPGHSEVVAVIEKSIQRIRESGKASGILQSDVNQAKKYLDLGVDFVAVGVDAVLLRRAATELLAKFKGSVDAVVTVSGSAY